MQGLEFLLASWDEPKKGGSIYTLMEQGLSYFQRIHEVVIREKGTAAVSDVVDLSARVLRALGLPQTALIPIVIRSIEAHLKVSQRKSLLAP